MASGRDDQLRPQWTRPGQTLRALVSRRARDPPEAAPRTCSQPMAASCACGSIIVRIMHWRKCRSKGKVRAVGKDVLFTSGTEKEFAMRKTVTSPELTPP